MKAAALVVLLSLTAWAADDAPVRTVKEEESLLVKGPALVLNAEGAVSVARRISACEGERDALKDTVAKQTPGWVLPVAIALSVLTGAAVGVGVTVALTPKPQPLDRFTPTPL